MNSAPLFSPPEEPFRVVPPFDAADVYRQYLAKKPPRPGDELMAATGMLSLGCALDALFHASRADEKSLASQAHVVAAYALLMVGHVAPALDRARRVAARQAPPEAHVLVALLVRLSGDFLGALEAATRAGMNQPDVRALVIAGALHHRARHLDRAVLSFRRARDVLARGRDKSRGDRTRKALRTSCDVYLALAAGREKGAKAARAAMADCSEPSLRPFLAKLEEGVIDEAEAHCGLARVWPAKRPEWRLFEAEMGSRASPSREEVVRFFADELAAARLFPRAADAYLLQHRAGGGAEALRSAGICAFRSGDTARAKERFKKARELDPRAPASVFENYAERGWGILDYAEAMVDSSRRALGMEHPRVALEHAVVALDTVGEHPGARLAAAKALLALTKISGTGSPAVSAIAAYQLLRSSSALPRGFEPVVSVLPRPLDEKGQN